MKNFVVRLRVGTQAESPEEAVKQVHARFMKKHQRSWSVRVLVGETDEDMGGYSMPSFAPSSTSPPNHNCPTCETDSFVDLVGEAVFIDGRVRVRFTCDTCLINWEEKL